MGGLYGGAAEFSSIVGLGLGSAFGTLLWAGTDLVAVPAVGFAALPTEEPTSAHVAHWLAHVVYADGILSPAHEGRPLSTNQLAPRIGDRSFHLSVRHNPDLRTGKP